MLVVSSSEGMQTEFTDQIGQEVIKPEHITPKLRRSCYGLILRKDGKILVVKDRWKPNIWSLPGGGVEDKESIEEGLRREIQEETGVSIQSTSKILHQQQQNFYARDIDTFFDSRISIHLIEDFIEKGEKTDNQEIKEARWVKASELHEGNVHKNHYPAIRVLQEESRKG